MNDRRRVDVSYSGAVLLGPDVACDGLHRDAGCRVQTHVHADHMSGFDASKGFQQILLTEGTRALLCVERDADLPYRANLHPLPYRERVTTGSSQVSFMPSGHMLGSAQVLVELDDGTRLGYSGDFSWPLDQVVKVDQLVVDATYGKPTSVRRYSQADCAEQLLALVAQRMITGPVHILAHRGTLHRALTILSGELKEPIIADADTIAEIDVYRTFGAPISQVLSIDDDEGQEAQCEGQYVWIGRPHRPIPASADGVATTVKLSAFFSRPDSPMVELGPRSFSIALSDHADFDGTLEYVANSGASVVVTDNTRGSGYDLAMALRERLGIEAWPSSNRKAPSETGW